MENLRLVRGGALETKKVKWGKPEDVITIEDGVVKFLYAPKGIISMFFRNIFKKYAAKNPITVYEFGLNIKDVLYSELILKSSIVLAMELLLFQLSLKDLIKLR